MSDNNYKIYDVATKCIICDAPIIILDIESRGRRAEVCNECRKAILRLRGLTTEGELT